jgi:hypothetical protein
MLMLEATIGLNEVDSSDQETVESTEEVEPGIFTSHDVSFLKSLRITLPDEEPLDLSDGSAENPEA